MRVAMPKLPCKADIVMATMLLVATVLLIAISARLLQCNIHNTSCSFKERQLSQGRVETHKSKLADSAESHQRLRDR